MAYAVITINYYQMNTPTVFEIKLILFMLKIGKSAFSSWFISGAWLKPPYENAKIF